MRVDFNFSIPSFLFIFSKAIIVKITSLLRSFLWNGSDLSSGNAKVAWDTVCLPKEEGGLIKKSRGMVKHL